MAIIIQKYGGTSIGDTDKIRHVAERIVRRKRAGDDVVVVVSAMANSTDDLIDLAKKIDPKPPEREFDMLLTAGERISMALMSMAIQRLGEQAV
ncbi:MAG: aspartate kinase, partial [bacterium]